jgi:hypothetical protein
MTIKETGFAPQQAFFLEGSSVNKNQRCDGLTAQSDLSFSHSFKLFKKLPGLHFVRFKKKPLTHKLIVTNMH